MEVLTNWFDVEPAIRGFIINEFGLKIKLSNSTLQPIFNLAQPKVTMGEGYWRIEPENAILLKKLIAEYGHE